MLRFSTERWRLLMKHGETYNDAEGAHGARRDLETVTKMNICLGKDHANAISELKTPLGDVQNPPTPTPGSLISGVFSWFIGLFTNASNDMILDQSGDQIIYDHRE